MFRKAKKAKNYVEEGLEKVRSKPWAEPLGKALQVSGQIVGAVEGFVPGANIIGGALSFGATLLDPKPSIEDLQKELRDIKEDIKQSKSQASVRALEKVQHDLEAKINQPLGEIKKEFGEVRDEMKSILKEVADSRIMTDEMIRIRDLVTQTFRIVVDTKYKVSALLSAQIWNYPHFYPGGHRDS